jgi:hypothetical protein
MEVIQATRYNSFTRILFEIYVRGSAVANCWLEYMNGMMIHGLATVKLNPFISA